MNKIELITQPETADRVKKTADKKTLEKLKRLVHDNLPTDGEPEVDSDGLEVPDGKIPIDGHFSTNELRELVELAKREGFLQENVVVKVIEENGKFGDRVIIEEREFDEHNDQGDDNSKEDGNSKENGQDSKSSDSKSSDAKSPDSESNSNPNSLDPNSLDPNSSSRPRQKSIGEDIANSIKEAQANNAS